MHTLAPDERRTVPLRTAFGWLGIGKTLGYRLVRDGRFPVPVLRLGDRLVVPVDPLERLLHSKAAQSELPPTVDDPVRHPDEAA